MEGKCTFPVVPMVLEWQLRPHSGRASRMADRGPSTEPRATGRRASGLPLTRR